MTSLFSVGMTTHLTNHQTIEGRELSNISNYQTEITLPKTHAAHHDELSQDESHLPPANFQGDTYFFKNSFSVPLESWDLKSRVVRRSKKPCKKRLGFQGVMISTTFLLSHREMCSYPTQTR